MKMKTIARLIPLVAAGLASGQAAAAGFQLLEQNASGIGNSYAGSAAVAENASTIFFNPAGMTQLKDREISVGMSAVRPTFKFSDRGSSSLGAFASAGEGNDAGSWAFIPNAYLSWALTKNLYAGLGIGAPFGLVTEYNDPWVGAAQAIKFDIKTININPSIAWRVNEKVSIGFGLNWQKMDAEYVRRAGAVTPLLGPLSPLSSTFVTLKADDASWGWNVGALFSVSEATKVGVSYRSKVKHELEGSLAFSGAAAQNPAFGGTTTLAVGDTATAVVRLDNLSRLPSGVLMVEDDLPWELGSPPRFVLDRMESGGSREVTYRVTSPVRGRWRWWRWRKKSTKWHGCI